jgi:23S rRNA pseudouridine2605 synthase
MDRKKKPPEEGARIAKVMARAGLCSRRDAEGWIVAGRVAVNGAVIRSPALNVGENDQIMVDGKPLPRRERTRLFLYHKPRGLVTTNADPEGRATIFETLPSSLPRLISVGRLDINSEGLLLLTNDGELARALELPETGWLRRYRVRALGRVSQARLDTLKSGISIDGINYGSVEATIDREQGANSWLTLGIREGKNREVRNVLGALGLAVNRLIRVGFGPFELADMPEGAVVEVPTRELRAALGERIAALADLDFSGPMSGAPPAREREFTPPRRERAGAPFKKNREERGRAAAPFKKGYEARERPPGASAGAPDARPKRVQPHHGDTHAWRGGDAPLRRKYRGVRADDWEPDPKNVAPKRTGEIADRKGRVIAVERIGEPKPERDRDDRRYGKFRGGPAGKGGERFSRGGPPRAGAARGEFRRDDKPRGKFARDEKPRGKPSREGTPRGQFERDKKPGVRDARQRRGFDRSKGPRPSRPRPKE